MNHEEYLLHASPPGTPGRHTETRRQIDCRWFVIEVGTFRVAPSVTPCHHRPRFVMPVITNPPTSWANTSAGFSFLTHPKVLDGKAARRPPAPRLPCPGELSRGRRRSCVLVLAQCGGGVLPPSQG